MTIRFPFFGPMPVLSRHAAGPLARGFAVAIALLAAAPAAVRGDKIADRLEAIRLKVREERMAAAEAERRALDEKRDKLLARIEDARQVRGWALGIKGRATPRSNDTVLLRWRMLHQRSARRYREMPLSEIRHAVAKGIALNFFLDDLGEAALEHELHLRRYKDLQMLAAQGKRPELTSVEMQRLDLLQEMEEACLISADILIDVPCEQGVTGPKLPIRLTAGKPQALEPLPLEWPAFFLTNGAYKNRLKAIEDARVSTIDEIRNAVMAGPGRQRLMDEIDGLKSDLKIELAGIQRRRTERANNNQAATSGSAVMEAPTREKDYVVLKAMSFVQTLQLSLGRLIEMRYLDQDPFESPRDDGKYSAIQLIAYMRQHGLRFAPSTANSEINHSRIFAGLATYYEAVETLKLAAEAERAEVEWTEQRIATIDAERRIDQALEAGRQFVDVFKIMAE